MPDLVDHPVELASLFAPHSIVRAYRLATPPRTGAPSGAIDDVQVLDDAASARFWLRPLTTYVLATRDDTAGVWRYATTRSGLLPAAPPDPPPTIGPAETVGAAGAVGDPGAVGPPGAPGPAGPKGDPGLPGAVGPTGPLGPKGDTGATGTPGAPGLVGAKGDRGDAGPIGLTGAQGAKGDPGATGTQGAQGLPGAAGSQGPAGLTGPQGLKGDPGTVGPTGQQGPQGPQGLPGLPGATGLTGPAGPTSPATPATLGAVKLSTAPADPLNPIAVETSDARLSNARTPATHAASHRAGATDALSGLTDAQLASPNNAAYKTLVDVTGVVAAAAAAGTRGFAHGALILTGTNVTQAINIVYLAAADWTVAGLTGRLRVKAQLLTNAVAPAGTWTFGLHPVTATAGAAGGITYTIGAAIAGSTIAFATPAASQRLQATSADFAFPADGFYCLGLVTSAAVAASAYVAASAFLQTRNT